MSLSQSLLFFGINTSLWLILSALIRTFLIGKFYLFFGILSETLVLIVPLFCGLLFLGLVLHSIAKLFRSRAKLKNNLKAVFFSSILLPLFTVPVFKVVAWIISIFILIYCFKIVNRFDKIRAIIAVLIPVSIFWLSLFALGIVNTNLLLR